MKKLLIILLMSGSFQMVSYPENPVIRNKGVNDPHIRIIDGKAYLAASHDKSIENKKFIMEDWWLWSSDDLVNWKPEYILKPEETYIGKPFDGCWAPDIVKRNGKFYWYFSERNPQSGFRNFTCSLPEMPDKQSICLIFGGKGLKNLQLDSFLFK